MVEEAGLQLPDFEESDFYVEQEQVSRRERRFTDCWLLM